MQEVTYDVRNLSDPAKYDRLVEIESPEIWWDLRGPLGGLHLLNAARVPYFEGVLDGFAGRRVLDVGCGGGIFAEPLAKGGAQVVGVDPSPGSLEGAREHARKEGLKIDYREAFAESFETDETFGTVMAVDVLEHVDDVDLTLDMCVRVLEPGGIFGFLTHNQTLKAFEELVWKGEYELGIIPKGNHDFHKFLHPEDLTERLAARGLRTADLKGVAFDFDTPSATLVDDLDVSYLGYAVKD